MTQLLHTPPRQLLGAVMLALCACPPVELYPFETAGTTDPGGTVEPGTTTSDAGQTASTSTTDAMTTDATTGELPLPSCDAPVSQCELDPDRDGVMDHCDNAPHHTNPDQSNVDGDAFGDVFDLCPTLPGEEDLLDTDEDGIGNSCDLCPRPPASYNDSDAPVPYYMQVRNIPQVEDSDHDGIGDACDNCVRTPNCQGYGDGLEPFVLGDAIDREASDCQADVDADLIGDACAGTTMPGAAGPVGFAPSDDFDQDGLTNAQDACPRQPVPPQACGGPEDCPASSPCLDGVCGHVDSDQDGVGDICDTCPWASNPQQIQLGAAEDDDPDGDFVGDACETDPLAGNIPNPRPFGFYDSSASGYCCVQLNSSGTVLDPDGDTVPIPASVLDRPGIGVLPPGCAQEGQPLNGTVDLATLWHSFCLLPQWDQDFDGLADAADLCDHAFDPDNTHYVDDEDKEWEHFGKYCQGDYSPEHLDPAMMCLPGT